ncbi:hypothetical protein [uncultured Tolumonas sp.]|uniref:hypothetical protein n=1 Tax=uncultured Tolumonas sp. TaxID=263765 RepID=UPI002930E636|nr:hypothetical protein [uncultured Tolumonas sp.]
MSEIPSPSLVQRVEKAINYMKEIKPENVAKGHRIQMSLRYFSDTYDISRTSLNRYPSLKKRVQAEIELWNQQFYSSHNSDVSSRKIQSYQDRITELESEVTLALTQQAEAWIKNLYLQQQLDDLQQQLKLQTQVVRMPSVVDGFPVHLSKKFPLWFQFELMRIFKAEEVELIANTILKWREQYGPYLPGGTSSFFSLLIRPESEFQYQTMLDFLGCNKNKVESLLKQRCI